MTTLPQRQGPGSEQPPTPATESPEDTENLPAPEVIAAEIVEDL